MTLNLERKCIFWDLFWLKKRARFGALFWLKKRARFGALFLVEMSKAILAKKRLEHITLT